MFILQGPYVSDLLIETLIYNKYPVLKNEFSQSLSKDFNFWESDYAVEQIKKHGDIAIYSNSEDSISWINKNLPFSKLPSQIELFKDKVKFRELIKDIYPDFFFKEVDLSDIKNLDIENITMPFIIKPSVGFFSMGVHRVNNKNEWQEIADNIHSELEPYKDLYPQEVMNISKFIIEELIEGEELAIDAVFDKAGRPIILDILQHRFNGNTDVSDRIYLTSKKIIKDNYKQVEALLNAIGKKIDLKNFPLHLEVRVDAKTNTIIPIEINPLRFAGWCCTDIAYYTYGINVYEYFQNQEFPSWDEVLADKGDEIYYFTIVDCPSGINHKQIENFDYDSFLANYEHTLEVRRFNHHKYPVIAYIVAQTNNDEEIDKMLCIDFKQFITLSQRVIN